MVISQTSAEKPPKLYQIFTFSTYRVFFPAAMHRPSPSTWLGLSRELLRSSNKSNEWKSIPSSPSSSKSRKSLSFVFLSNSFAKLFTKKTKISPSRTRHPHSTNINQVIIRVTSHKHLIHLSTLHQHSNFMIIRLH